jgi:hypothetical protein
MTTENEKAAAIAQFAAALVNLDHALRILQGCGTIRRSLKQQLNILHNHTDKFLLASQKQFDCSDADAVNALSEVLGVSAHLLLQMTPQQIEASLQHMKNMVQSGGAYVPALTA